MVPSPPASPTLPTPIPKGVSKPAIPNLTAPDGNTIHYGTDGRSSAAAYDPNLPANRCVTQSVSDLYASIEIFEILSNVEAGTYFETCSAILSSGESRGTGMYWIDVDRGGGEDPFMAFCEMDRSGGGWTLVAHHQDCLDDVETAEVVAPDALGVMPSGRWRSLRDTMQEGLLTLDGTSRQALIHRPTLETAECHSVFDLDALDKIQGDRVFIHWSEQGTCDHRGLDYTGIVLGGREQSNSDIAGATVYNGSSSKFDVWPYDGLGQRYPGTAYEVQDDLLIFVK